MLIKELFEDNSWNEVQLFLNSLTPDDVGVDTVGPYRIHYEGFSDWCQQDAAERCSLPSTDPRHLSSYDDVYDEVLRDFIGRENGQKPIDSGLVGDEDYPIFYAVFASNLNEGPTWNKIKRTAAAGAMASGLGYAALTGQMKDQPQQPTAEPAAVTQVQPDTEKPADPVQKKAEKPAEKPLPSTATNADPAMEKLIFVTAWRSGLRGHELAQFMAQTAHETLGFTQLVEQGDKDYFKKYDPKHNPNKAKVLGNAKPGDGAKYKGRGFLQITGRDIYRRAGKALNLPLEQHPEMVSKPEIAAKVAVWFWQNRVSPKIEDFTDTIGVTTRVNPSMNGLGDRDLNYHSYVRRMKGILDKG